MSFEQRILKVRIPADKRPHYSIGDVGTEDRYITKEKIIETPAHDKR